MMLDSIWPLVLIAAGCMCVVCYSIGFDVGHSRGHKQARDIYENWLGKAL